MTRYMGWRITRRGIVAVLVAIVFAGLLYGALSVVQQRGETARREEALQIALEQLEEESAKPGVIAVTPPADTTANPTSPVPSELPQTGMNGWMILPLVALTYATSLYVMSQRNSAKTRLSSVFRVK